MKKSLSSTQAPKKWSICHVNQPLINIIKCLFYRRQGPNQVFFGNLRNHNIQSQIRNPPKIFLFSIDNFEKDYHNRLEKECLVQIQCYSTLKTESQSANKNTEITLQGFLNECKVEYLCNVQARSLIPLRIGFFKFYNITSILLGNSFISHNSSVKIR